MAWLSSLLLLTLGITRCSSAILESTTDLDQLNLEFDFIIVGGGTAGNVVANRLSENPDHSVLVLEAGGSNADVLDIIVPFYCNWNFTTTPQAGLNGRSIAYNRGFVLGAAVLSVNYMVYTRGSKEDFDRWAKVTGDDGWSWDNLVPYMKKNERFSSPSDHHNTTGQFNPDVHGFHGVNSVPVDSRVIETTTELGEYPFNLDMNSGYQLGIGWGQATIKNGSRSSSATSYLAPQFVALTRVLPTTSNTFRKRLTLTAKKEIILSAGSIGTPNILLHSGIGNSSTLTRSVLNLDHSLVFFSFLVNSNDTYETAERNATLAAEQFAQWNTSRMAGPNTSHYELIISNGMLASPPPGNFLSVTPAVVSPASRRWLGDAQQQDPLAMPLINPNLLGSDVDVFIMREAVKSAMHFTTAPAWQNYVISPFGLNYTSTDAEIDDFVRENGGTVYHPVGTASMSPKDADWGVVDPDLRVKGLTGLRIVDLSVVPFIPAAHTQAAAYIIGERASDLIKES
ncbi:alcohol oxidase [Mycena leptocephala]|nr:alcohol oxidase [Mycena leptocephala]